MNFAVLLAAGSSRRFEASCPPNSPLRDKLRVRIGGKPLWKVAYDSLASCPAVGGVGIICPPGAEREFEAEGAAFVLPGGQNRNESAATGIAASPPDSEIVVVHDAARPLASQALISRVILAAEEFGAAIPALPVTDTLKEGDEWVLQTLPRDGISRAQTPQAARRDWLLEAVKAHGDFTDEAMALESAGFPVRLVAGEDTNIKITTANDLDLAFPARASTGFGYDIHRFSSDPLRRLVLGGVNIPNETGLEGHSDADVVLHVLTDAILGAVGEGDIGEMFPDTELKWKDADSGIFVQAAAQRLAAAGAWLESADVTVLAETPTLSEYKERMRDAISRLLCVERTAINIKATTSEGIGAIGRGEGIATFATVTVYRRKFRNEV